jgi:hypothetical protein
MIKMSLAFNDADPVVTCQCGWHGHGDSIMDALKAWAEHLTSTPACREKL